jgi:iron complex outermembrane receptor protein
MKSFFNALLITSAFLINNVIANENIEEVIVTGTLLKNAEQDSSPVDVISESDYRNLNISNIAEISKYISSSSGSHFQANTLDGVDQGMAAITLRGLDHASTLLLINSKRQTFAGTPSHEGEGYIDANIIPEIALKRIEILKEGATSMYGSDAVAGVINMITQKNFKGLKIQAGRQSTTNYDQNDNTLGVLFGSSFKDGNYVIGINLLDRSPLSASEMPEIAELGISSLGRSFKVSEADSLSTGLWAGDYTENQKIPDPNCISNGGVLTNSATCGFLYGNRFNIVNDEDHSKFYTSLNYQAQNFIYELTFMASNVNVHDNPQSPSYPALPFLSRKIQPGEGGSPFNVPVTWYGRPLGSESISPKSPKDIKQYHLSQTIYASIGESTDVEFSFTKSNHSNNHYRPDIIDSRFQEALTGTSMGIAGGDQVFWSIFDPSSNSQSLIDFVTGAEISTKEAGLESLDLVFRTNLVDYNFAYGLQSNKENLNISYDELSRAEFDKDGKIIKTADLFFLGGGRNVSKNRSKYAGFFEVEKEFIERLDIRLAGRYENFNNDSSFDPKISLKYHPSEKISFRASKSSSFSMPSMAQMFSSDINLGSVRDFNGDSPFVRQAQIGNPNLKPATSKNTNIGIIFNDTNYKFTIDYWGIDYKDRIEVESAQAMLNSNPNGPSITRNIDGDLIGVTTTYFNEESTEVSGLDISYESLLLDSKEYGKVIFSINGTSINKFLTPDHEEHEEEEQAEMINRVGKFNYDAHTHSLPKKRINAFINWNYRDYGFNLNARHIDGYSNERPITGLGLTYGYKNKVDSFLVFDFSASKLIKLNNGEMDLKFSIINIFDESAPRLYDAPDFSFDSRVHDPRGRIIGLNLEYRK